MCARSVLAGAYLNVWLTLAGCTVGDDALVDPPEHNPHPTQRVKIHVTAPPSLQVRIGADYRVGTWLGMMGGGGTSCGPDVHARGDAVSHALPGTTVPIDLKRVGSDYEGEFFIDNCLPGRCHWGFFSLNTLSPAEDSVSLNSQQTVNYNFDTSHSHGVYDQSAAQSTDLWCGADPSPEGRENGKTLCTSLNYFVVYPGVVANELLASVPIAQRDHTALVNIIRLQHR